MSRQINPRKLLNSKWTAVSPRQCSEAHQNPANKQGYKEKHFLVVKVHSDQQETITHCDLEAIISRRQETIDWRQLLDEEKWQQGWK